MNDLIISDFFRRRLDRLVKQTGPLRYSGKDLSAFDAKPIVAIVGTRKPTPYGKEITTQLARDLSRAGVIIVSGLAYGVDVLSHMTVVKEGLPTVSILPSGLNNVYPVSHTKIARSIIETGGTLISEYPDEHKPRKQEFHARNRIIAALSDAVIVTEAAERSGSLNTASHARRMNIPIFAVPGPITAPMSKGTNYLLKNGARAVTEANDVLKTLSISTDTKQLALDLTGSNPTETQILKLLHMRQHTTSELQIELSIPITDLQVNLSMLEIAGKVHNSETDLWSLR